MVDADWRQHRECGPGHHIGGIESPAHAGFQQHNIRRRTGEAQQRGGGFALKGRERRVAVGGEHTGQERCELNFGDALAGTRTRGQPHAVVQTMQRRREVGVHAPSVCFQHRAQEGDQRALGIGTRDMDHRRQPLFGIAQSRQQAAHPVEGEIDALLVQAAQDRKQRRAAGLDGRHATDQEDRTLSPLRTACPASAEWHRPQRWSSL